MNGFLRSLGALALALLLASCGGGGGGGGGGGFAGLPASGSGSATSPTDPNPPTTLPIDATYTTVNLSVSNVTPTSISGTYYVGNVMLNTSLRGTGIGDASVVAGKTLYVLIEDPAGLFESATSVSVTAGPPPGMLIMLKGKKLEKVGEFTGSLRIYVCLDIRCSVRLGNVPYSIPYDIKVKDNAVPAVDKVELATGFGAVPTPQTVSVTSPSGWASSNLVVSSNNPLFSADFTQANADGTAALTVGAKLALPGTYTATLTISVKQSTPTYPAPLSVTLPVSYTVAPDANVPYVFGTEGQVLALKAGQRNISESYFTAFATPGTLQYDGLEYLTTPDQDAAAYVNHRRNWLQVVTGTIPGHTLGHTMRYLGCYGTGAFLNGQPVVQCLPPDAYAFRLRYKHLQNGTTTTVYYYGAMVISP
ncbi:hypothetical protein C7T35_28640 [Variovorax sp. WS11]|uniref:hypothetical protein n=1 Tax=Variovorax sp. WS11 TaxID=1105204 RepID=UPI000D0DE96C|nr:hypothetical protein [Variovorax sp. WS11]PSL81143.1 hypothetical protein C7T35_28640 [Variovorax sp. WS11]